MDIIQQAINILGLDGIGKLYHPPISPQAVHKWKEKGCVPEDRSPEIERATDGVCQCEGLCPVVSWVRIHDPKWPNPQGRPLVDHSQKKAA